MINVEGAGVLAQVIPVGLLVLAFEARREDAIMGGTPFMEKVVAVGRWVLIGIVIASVMVESVCINAVSSGTAIRGAVGVFVYVVGYALSFAVAIAILIAVMRVSGFTDALIERQMRDPVVRERLEAAVARAQRTTDRSEE